MTAHADMPLIEHHIHKHIGKIHRVFHELESDDIHLDVCHVKSGLFRSHECLVTMGMSALPLNVPEGYQGARFVELMILLPKKWALTEQDFNNESSYWPIRLLKDIARFAHHNNTFIGFGHTVADAENADDLEPFASNTEFCASIMLPPISLGDHSFCLKRDGEQRDIHFFAVIPLYRDELLFKMEQGSDALLDRFDQHQVSDVVDLKRPSVV